MKYKKLKIAWVTVFTFLLCLISISAQDKNDDKFRIVYDDENDRTTVILNGIELPKNKDSLSIGASFEFKGKTLEKIPCCAVLFFTSMSKKQFNIKKITILKFGLTKKLLISVKSVGRNLIMVMRSYCRELRILKNFLLEWKRTSSQR